MDLSSTVFAFLPIIGGYRFARRWNLSRFTVVREDGHKLYFRAAFYGLLLFIALYGIFFLIQQFELLWTHYASHSESKPLTFDPTVIWPSQLAFQTVAVLTALSGGGIAWAVNKYAPRLAAYERWSSNTFLVWLKGDPLEDLLYGANKQERAIAFSMDNNLVFVGYWVASSAPSEKQKWIQILPLASGYRDDHGSMQLRTQYSEMYEDVRNKAKGLDHLEETDFYKVIDRERVISANLFDVKAFIKFGDLRLQSAKKARSSRTRATA